MDDLYREHILDHYKHPRNFGILKYANVVASDNLVSCGDQLSMQLQIKNNVVVEVMFQGQGCAISISSASMLTEIAKNKTIDDLKTLNKDDILRMLGINPTPTRLNCVLLSLEVLHQALNKYGKV
ncbi:MAG: iron-sulfur cluster assembly scaffold protein [Patescibacteria group bacterium]